jgi:cell division protein FtsQ
MKDAPKNSSKNRTQGKGSETVSGTHLRSAQASYKKSTSSSGSSKQASARKQPTFQKYIDYFEFPSLFRGKKNQTKKSVRYEAPPVMIRSTPMTRPLAEGGRHVKSTVRQRRQFKVPDVPGASISLPALQGLLDWRIVSLFLVVGLSVGLYLMWTSSFFVVSQADIFGLKRIMSHDVNVVLDIGGTPSFALDPADLQKSLVEQFPEFSAAMVTVEFPNTVAISVTERIPVLAWRQGGRTDLIDKDGLAFPLRSNDVELDLPTVDASGLLVGLIPAAIPTDTEKTDGNRFQLFGSSQNDETIQAAQQVLTPEAVQSILMLNEFAPQGIPLTYRDDHGFGWQDSAGWMVYFGDATQIQLKLNIYQDILELINNQGVKPELISVEWVHAPYYRLEP